MKGIITNLDNGKQVIMSVDMLMAVLRTFDQLGGYACKRISVKIVKDDFDKTIDKYFV